MLNKDLLGKFLLLLAFLNIIFIVIKFKDKFLKHYDHQEMAKIYSESQYVKGPAAKTAIGDDGLYSFAGYYYLIQGGDISKVNFENPPLGKYLIGLSILLFGNGSIISIIYEILLLYIIFKIGEDLFNQYVASLAVLIMSFSPLFLDQLLYSLLDLPLTLFIATAVYFYLKGKNKSVYLYISSLFLALSLSTKFFPALIIIIGILIVDVYGKEKKFFISYLKSLILLPVIYLLVHFRYFYYHPSFIEFLKYQRWIISWRSGNPYLVGNIINTIFLGKYQSWWDTNLFLKYDNWSILSPLIPTFAFLSLFFSTKKEKQNLLLLWSISFIFFIYVIFGTTGVEKYLLPVYPLLVILCSYTVVNLFGKIKQQKIN